MTGRDLIVHILENHLEANDVGFIIETLFEPSNQTAIRFRVGTETVKTWYILGLVPGFIINDEVYILRTAEDPRKVDKK